MTWDEWERIKADASTRQATSTQLNQLAPAAGGGVNAPDLASCPAAKKAAAKAIGQDLEPGVARDGRHAAEQMNTTVKEFGPKDGYGWDTSGALKRAHKTWESQVKMLLGRLASEKALLSETGAGFRSNDLGIAAQLTRQSRIHGV
ncbi:hypothetical protein [Streptomyces sp. NPDC056061]|uniref:hypothetical protein n=1 Tax=Streptomyces sp. NPDC056061 TaxID=3345700 RepID=UPI0035D70DB1